MADSYYQTLK